MQYKGGPDAVARIGRDLGVDYAVLGSVGRGAERVRVGVSLVKLSDRTQLFAETYEREARDLLKLQREIAQEIARRIGLRLLKVDDRLESLRALSG